MSADDDCRLAVIGHAVKAAKGHKLLQAADFVSIIIHLYVHRAERWIGNDRIKRPHPFLRERTGSVKRCYICESLRDKIVAAQLINLIYHAAMRGACDGKQA